MQRKLVRQGRNAATLTLPSEWVKRNGLKPGDDVEIIEHKNSILVNPPKKQNHEQFEITIQSTNEWYIKQVVRFCYFSDFSLVKIQFTDPKMGSTIRDYIPSLLGMEIIDHSKNSFTLKNFSLEMSDEVQSFYRKIFLLTLSLFDYLLDLEHHFDDSYFEIKDDILKFERFCRKVYLKEMDNSNKLNHYILLQRLGMICSNLFYLYRYLKGKHRKALTKLELFWLQRAKEQYHLLYDILYKKEADEIFQLDERRKEFYDMVENLASIKPAEVPVICCYIGEIIRLVAASGTVVWYIINEKS